MAATRAKKGQRRAEARESLPEHLREIFDDLVVDYQGFAMKHHKGAWVSYLVLADLVREGWRRSAKEA